MVTPCSLVIVCKTVYKFLEGHMVQDMWSDKRHIEDWSTRLNFDLLVAVSELKDLTSTHPAVTLNSTTCYITSRDENNAVSYDERDNPALSTQPTSYAVAVRNSLQTGWVFREIYCRNLGMLSSFLSSSYK